MKRMAFVVLLPLAACSLAVFTRADEPQVRVSGKAIDDETGEPVAPLIVQGGMFDPKDPSKVT